MGMFDRIYVDKVINESSFSIPILPGSYQTKDLNCRMGVVRLASNFFPKTYEDGIKLDLNQRKKIRIYKPIHEIDFIQLMKEEDIILYNINYFQKSINKKWLEYELSLNNRWRIISSNIIY